MPKCVRCGKMRGIWLTFFGFCAIIFPLVKGQCGWVPGILEIEDTQVNEQIFEYQFDETFSFTSWLVTSAEGGLTPEEALSYFDYNTTDTSVAFYTTDKFANLNRDSYTGKNILTISIEVKIKCGTDRSGESTLIINIRNTNQNAPEFSSSSFTYTLPMPIMPRTDFSLFGDDSITATDIDFSTTDITFSIEPDDFTVTSIKEESKTYRAVFSARNIITFDDRQEYTLTATDSGNPPKSNSVIVTLLVDNVAGLDTPRFLSPYYKYDFIVDTDPTLTNTTEAITIKSVKPNEAKQYSLDGDYAELFDLTYHNDTMSFEIELKEGSTWPSDVLSEIILTLSFTTDSTANTIILITAVTDPIPKFNSDYYVGTYDMETNTITWKEDFEIEGAMAVSLKGDKSNLLSIDPNSYEIKPVTTLTPTDFDENSNIIITLVAETKNSEATVLVVISMEGTTSLRFNSAFYRGEYKINNKTGQVTLEQPIGFLDFENVPDITIEIDQDYTKYFKIELNERSEWTVTVLEDLTPTILDANTELSIPITASREGQSANSILLLKLPEKIEIKFSKPSYTGSYKIVEDSEKDQIIMDDGDIITIEGVTNEKIQITLDGFEGYLEGVCDPVTLECEIVVKNNLNASVLSDNNQLLITLSARNDDNSISGKAVLLLNLPDKHSTFSFTQPYYSAIYSIERDDRVKATVMLNDAILFKDADSSEVTISLDKYENNFKLTFDTNWILEVEENLNSDVLKDNTELVIPLTAQRLDENDVTKAVLSIKLPDKLSLSFIDLHYSGTYQIDDDGNPHVVLTTNIQTTTDDVQIILNDYYDNFQLVLDDSATWSVKVINRLDALTFTERSELKLTMTVTKVGVKYGESILTIKLPSPTFTQGFYDTEYYEDEEGAKIGSPDIEVLNVDIEDIEVTLSSHTEYFSMVLEETKWILKLEGSLSDEILQTQDMILTDLVALRKRDKERLAISTLVIALPSMINATDGPKFTQFTYHGNYDNGSVLLDDEITIKYLETLTNLDVSIENSDEYSSNFDVNLISEGKYDIIVTNALSPDVLSSKTSIVLTLVATSDEGRGFATLVITLPKTPREKSVELKDEEILYSGKFENGAFKSPVIIFKSYSTDMNVEITNDLGLNKYFIPHIDENQLTIEVDDLPEDILEQYAVILLKLAITDENTGDTVHAVVNIELDYAVGPKFTQFTYHGVYNNGSVLLDDEITIKYLESFTNLDVSIENSDEYSSNFDVNLISEGKYGIIVTSPLSPDVLSSETSIVLTLVATSDEGSGFATLVITLPKMPRERSVELKDEEILYSGKYENGAFKSPVIIFESYSTDIKVDITNDLGLNKYFTPHIDENQLTIEVDDLPEDILEEYAVILLKIAITDENTGDTVHAVVNIELDYESGGDDQDGETTDSARTGLIVAVSILAFLLVGAIGATFLLWYCKIRNYTHKQMEDEIERPMKDTELFAKNPKRQESTPVSSSSLRRPTGFPFNFQRPESPTEDTLSDFEPQVIHNQKVEPQTNDNGNKPIMNEYVFGKPQYPENEKASPDSVGTDPDKKKSVIFDENVERMQIDTVDDEESEAESDGKAETYEVAKDEEKEGTELDDNSNIE